MRVAIIPARSGSKRIVGKNIRDFCGKPIISYAIEAAFNSELFEHVIVSTDCPKIAKVANKYGASTPFLREPALSDDFTPIVHVVRDAVNWIEKELGTVEYACCLYATAPLIRSSDIRRGLDLLTSNPNADFAVAVTSFDFPVFRALHTKDGMLNLVWPEYELTRSQDLPEVVHDAGAFYWGTTEAYRSSDWVISKSVPIPIPSWLVQDIDTEEDWLRAELLYRAIHALDFQEDPSTD